MTFRFRMPVLRLPVLRRPLRSVLPNSEPAYCAPVDPDPDRGFPHDGDIVLSVDDASVSRDGITLLPPTSLTVAAGECVAVRGENGAGKTTLLRVLAGRLKPTSGSAALAGDTVDERRPEARRAIAALIDPPALYPDLTVADHLEFIVAAWAPFDERNVPETVVPSVDPSAIEAALRAFGLSPLRDRFPDELSSGQRQLVALAVTFARPARVILLDEPEQRLDPDRLALLAAAIHGASERGISVVFASHSAALVAAVAHRSVRVAA